MRTWIIIDLLLVSALVGAWIAWRLSKRRFDTAAAEAGGAAESDSAPSTDLRAAPSVSAVNGTEPTAALRSSDPGQLQVIVDVAQGRGEDVLASLRPALGLLEPVELEPATMVEADGDVTSGAADGEQGDRNPDVDPAGEDAVAEEASASVAEQAMAGATGAEDDVADAAGDHGDDAPSGSATGVDVRRTTDVSGPLGADRLVFHTENAPALLTKVLTGLRERGYEIEMVVHHEVILHDVDAGVARICVAHPGEDLGAGGGLAPTSIADAPMVV